MVHVPLMFLSEWREFPSAFKEKKTWWQLASLCCWNRAHRLTWFLSASVTRKDLQFGTWTDPSFQGNIDSVLRHREVGRAKDLPAPPRTGQLEKSPQLLSTICLSSVNINNMCMSINLIGFKDTAHLMTQSYPITGLDRLQETEAPRISRQSARGGGKSALGTGRLYPQKIPWYSFLLDAESTIVRPKGWSKKNPNGPIGNRTRVLPTWSTVPQPRTYNNLVPISERTYCIPRTKISWLKKFRQIIAPYFENQRKA